MKRGGSAHPIYEIVVIGVSAGGFQAIPLLLRSLDSGFPLPVIIVQHEAQDSGGFFSHFLEPHCRLAVKQAEEKETILPGMVYIAPPGYHLLVEQDRSFSLSIDACVNYARPSIDVLFETVIDVYGAGTIGIILTGANSDGAEGLKRIKDAGGRTIVQDPANAEFSFMPRAALAATSADEVLPLDRIGPYLNAIVCDLMWPKKKERIG
jgi:two-component system, chemotaxis family, protein-glutamate methylesterase/glutaminase